MQTLVFNTSTKSAKLYEGNENSAILHTFDNVPTVKVTENYYEVMQEESWSTTEEKATRVPVARFPISNTNMLIKK